MIRRITLLFASLLFIAILLIGCNSPDSSPSTTNKKSVAWDTAKIKAAVDSYLKTHEKYYSLIDTITYDIDTMNAGRIAFDQASYFKSLAFRQDILNHTEYVVTPGSPNTTVPISPSTFHDSATIFYKKAEKGKDAPLLGFRVFITYRLSNVMLTYSDYTPYVFYFDTAYNKMSKKDFLHYTNIQLTPPTESGIYLDTPYVYVPPKQ